MSSTIPIVSLLGQAVMLLRHKWKREITDSPVTKKIFILQQVHTHHPPWSSGPHTSAFTLSSIAPFF